MSCLREPNDHIPNVYGQEDDILNVYMASVGAEDVCVCVVKVKGTHMHSVAYSSCGNLPLVVSMGLYIFLVLGVRVL